MDRAYGLYHPQQSNNNFRKSRIMSSFNQKKSLGQSYKFFEFRADN